MDEIAAAFAGMEIVGMNPPKSTGTIGVTVGKNENYEYRTRTLLMRHEKAGWKVQDLGRLRIQELPTPRTADSTEARAAVDDDQPLRSPPWIEGGAERSLGFVNNARVPSRL